MIKVLITKILFRLFPIISISQKFFYFFFLALGKIGIDEKVICYHNISNELWKKIVQVGRKKISKTLQILGLKASNLQTFFSIFFLTLEQFFLTVR